MKKIIIYHRYMPKLGGIETAVYNVAKIFSKFAQVAIMYEGAESDEVIFNYSEVADVIRTDYGELECDILLVASNHPIPRSVKYKKVWQWIHSDYEKYSLTLANKPELIDQYISVSDHAAKIAKKLFNIDCVVIQNLLDPDFKRPDLDKVLKFITTSRISPEKGFGRMLVMTKALRAAGIPFQWFVYGDNSHALDYEAKVKKSFINEPEVIFCGYKRDIKYALAQADYLVQLSDFEGCPYAVLEALAFGVPCILTDFPSAFELITEGENGYIMPMDMKKIDYSKLLNIPNNFVFSQEKELDKWLKIFNQK